MIQIKPFVSLPFSGPQTRLLLWLLQTKYNHKLQSQLVFWPFLPLPSSFLLLGRRQHLGQHLLDFPEHQDASLTLARMWHMLQPQMFAGGTTVDQEGGNTPLTDFRASSLLLSLPLHHFLIEIIGKEGRSYKYLWKLKGACTVLAERENIWRVLAPLPYTYWQVFTLKFFICLLWDYRQNNI